MTRPGRNHPYLLAALSLFTLACGETGKRHYSQREGKAGRAAHAQTKDANAQPDGAPSSDASSPQLPDGNGKADGGGNGYRPATNVMAFRDVMKAGVSSILAASDTQMLLLTNASDVYYADSRRPEQAKVSPDTPLINLGKEVGLKPGAKGFRLPAVSSRYMLFGNDDDLRVVELATFRSASIKAQMAPSCRGGAPVAENGDEAYLALCGKLYRFKAFSETMALAPVDTGADFGLDVVLARDSAVVAYGEKGMVVSRDGGKTFVPLRGVNGATGEPFIHALLFDDKILVATPQQVYVASLGDLAFSAVIPGGSPLYMHPSLLHKGKIYLSNGFVAGTYDTATKVYKPLAVPGMPRAVGGSVVFLSKVYRTVADAAGKNTSFTEFQLFYPDPQGAYRRSQAILSHIPGEVAKQYTDVIDAVFDWNGTMQLFGSAAAYSSTNLGESVTKWQ